MAERSVTAVSGSLTLTPHLAPHHELSCFLQKWWKCGGGGAHSTLDASNTLCNLAPDNRMAAIPCPSC